MSSWTTMALLALLSLAVACTAGGGSDGGAAGGQGGPPGETVRVLVRPMIFLEPQLRADFLELRATLEAEGYRLSSDGAVLVWPDSPAAGWRVELGSRQVRLDLDATFLLNPIPDGVRTGLLHHPDDRMASSFTVEQAAAAAREGGALVIPVPFRGPCGMNAEDDEFCGLGQRGEARVDRAAATAPRTVGASDCRPALNFYNRPRQVIYGARGSYPDPTIPFVDPNPSNPTRTDCPQEDGLLQGRILPGKTRKEKRTLLYPGSTCDVYVRAGACPNEQPLSDVEYSITVGGPGNPINVLLNGLLGGGDAYVTPPFVQTDFASLVSCYNNHRGRNCAMLCVGDVSCDFIIDGVVLGPGEEGTLPLPASGLERFVVHNNGVFGFTQVIVLKSEIGGFLSGPGLRADGETGGYTVRHFEPQDYKPTAGAGSEQYLPDRTLVYTPAPEAQVGAEDTFRFLVDDRAVTVTFRIVPTPTETVSPSPSPSPSPSGSPAPSPQPSETVVPSPSPSGTPSPPPPEVGFFINSGDRLFGRALDGSTGALASSSFADVGAGTNPRALIVTGLTVPPRTTGGVAPLAVYTANNPANTLSGFLLGPGGSLTAIAGSPFAAGSLPANNFGAHPMASTASGRFLYVANSANVSGFSVSTSGVLAAVPGSPFTAGTTPRDVVVLSRPSGDYAYVSERDRLHAFRIQADGSLAALAGSPVVLPLPGGWSAFSSIFDTGMESTPGGGFLYFRANRAGSSTDGALFGFSVDPSTGALAAVPGSPFPTGQSGGIDIDPTGTWLYECSFSLNALQVFRIEATGALTEVAGSPFATVSGPNRVSVSDSGNFVYSLSASQAGGFSVNPTTGALTSVPGSPFSPPGIMGDLRVVRLSN